MSDQTSEGLLDRIRREVERQIDEYVYEVPEGTLGVPLSADKIREYLAKMRRCLVEPRWEQVEIRSTLQEIQSGVGRRCSCAILAEDSNYVLVFDPLYEEYHLAWRGNTGLATWGVSGDAVGCFIAR